MELRRVLVDGITIDATEQSAEAIKKLQTSMADSVKLVDARDGEIVALKKQIEAKDGEIAGLNKAHNDVLAIKDAALAAAESNIDKRIEERQAVILDAEVVAGKAISAKGKTVAALRREAVIMNMGDAAVKDRSDEYVEAIFNTLSAQGARKDPLRQGVADSVHGRRTRGGVDEREAAYADYLASLQPKGAK